ATLNARRARLPTNQRLPARGGLVTGLLARGLSPHPYLFWFLVGAPTLLQAEQEGWPTVAGFLLGYYATIVGSNVGLALALHRWMRLLSNRLYRSILLLASFILAACAVVLLGRAADLA